jgi:hypothetical protein
LGSKKHDAVKSAIVVCAWTFVSPLAAIALEPATSHAALPGAPAVVSLPPISATFIGSKLDALSFSGWDLVKQSIWQRQSVDDKSPLSSYFYGDETKSLIISEYKVNLFARKTIARGQRTIYIDIYQFDQSAGALAAYYYLRKGATTVIKRGDASSEEDDSISFCQGTLFVSIYGTSEDDDESKDVIRKCADGLSHLTSAPGVKPEVMRQMPVLDLIAGSEKLVAGPVSARKFCPAPYLPVLVGEGNEIVWGSVADYQIQAPYKERLKLLITEYATAEAAQSHYAAYMAELGSGHGEMPATRLAGNANVFKLASTFIAVELKGKTICLVTGAKKRFSPQLLLQQMRY